jgi:cytochrome P450
MCIRTLADHPEFQDRLRADPGLVAPFVEEMLRTEAPLKGSFKLSRVATTVGGVDLAPGTTVFVMTDAASRDPRVFDQPAEFRLDRANGRQHLGFGHGIHTCAGAPLARAETHATLVRFLDRMSDIRISEAHHGPPNERRYEYDPTYMLRGLKELHVEFDRVQ